MGMGADLQGVHLPSLQGSGGYLQPNRVHEPIALNALERLEQIQLQADAQLEAFESVLDMLLQLPRKHEVVAAAHALVSDISSTLSTMRLRLTEADWQLDRLSPTPSVIAPATAAGRSSSMEQRSSTSTHDSSGTHHLPAGLLCSHDTLVVPDDEGDTLAEEEDDDFFLQAAWPEQSQNSFALAHQRLLLESKAALQCDLLGQPAGCNADVCAASVETYTPSCAKHQPATTAVPPSPYRAAQPATRQLCTHMLPAAWQCTCRALWQPCRLVKVMAMLPVKVLQCLHHYSGRHVPRMLRRVHRPVLRLGIRLHSRAPPKPSPSTPSLEGWLTATHSQQMHHQTTSVHSESAAMTETGIADDNIDSSDTSSVCWWPAD